MKTIEATYRIVTPMFIGGANQEPSDGIRPPSFKGALRFWWRALNWGKYHDLVKLHKKEAELFGSAAKMVNGKQVGGQGVFLLSINELGARKTLNDWPKANTGAGYLAYGILESKGGKRGVPVPHRVGIQEGLRFLVRLKFRPNTNMEDVESVEKAMEVFGLLGGLGSRSRRGHGSITKEDDGKLLDAASYQQKLDDLFASETALSPYTALSSHASYHLSALSNDARKALNSVGNKYKEYRATIKGNPKKRISFGLPLQGVDEDNRRASPLIFHVQALENQQFAAVTFTMPSSDFHHIQKYRSINDSSIKAFMGGLS